MKGLISFRPVVLVALVVFILCCFFFVFAFGGEVACENGGGELVGFRCLNYSVVQHDLCVNCKPLYDEPPAYNIGVRK